MWFICCWDAFWDVYFNEHLWKVSIKQVICGNSELSVQAGLSLTQSLETPLTGGFIKQLDTIITKWPFLTKVLINCSFSVSTVQYSTVQYSTIQYSTVQYSTVQYSTVQYSTVQYSTIQYSTVQYSTVLSQYSTVSVQYSTVQYSTVQYCLSIVQ